MHNATNKEINKYEMMLQHLPEYIDQEDQIIHELESVENDIEQLNKRKKKEKYELREPENTSNPNRSISKELRALHEELKSLADSTKGHTAVISPDKIVSFLTGSDGAYQSLKQQFTDIEHIIQNAEHEYSQEKKEIQRIHEDLKKAKKEHIRFMHVVKGLKVLKKNSDLRNKVENDLEIDDSKISELLEEAEQMEEEEKEIFMHLKKLRSMLQDHLKISSDLAKHSKERQKQLEKIGTDLGVLIRNSKKRNWDNAVDALENMKEYIDALLKYVSKIESICHSKGSDHDLMSMERKVLDELDDYLREYENQNSPLHID